MRQPTSASLRSTTSKRGSAKRSPAWDQSINDALLACKVRVIVIGRSWLAPGADGKTPRLHEAGDVVCQEISSLIEQGKAIVPLLVENARLPETAELPPQLRALLRFQAAAIDNASWGATIGLLIREIEAVIRHSENSRGEKATNSATKICT